MKPAESSTLQSMENSERPTTRMNRVAPAALAIAALVFSACGGSRSTDAAPDSTAPPGSTAAPASTVPPGSKEAPASKDAPDFTVETFEGEAFSLAEHRGTPVVLNFWESW